MNALKLGLFALAAATSLVIEPGHVGAVPVVQSQFSFSGSCTVDCTGLATGLLTLDNYTLGTTLTFGEFVSFSYHSNFLDLLITPADLNFIVGTIVGPLPSAENVAINGTIFGDIFTTSTFGGWCAGRGCNGDIGINGVWAAVPEPGTLALFLSGLFGAALLGRRRRRAVSV